MNRSGYSDDLTSWETILWSGAVKSAIRGKRGQAFLRELIAALDAMPEKRLIAEELVTEEGDCCAMGAVCKARGMDVSRLDPEECESVARAIGLSQAMVREIAYENDSCGDGRQRWQWMRKWAAANLVETA